MSPSAPEDGPKQKSGEEKMSAPKTKSSNLKHSYTIPCSSSFRDRVNALADERKVNVADLARSVLLMVTLEDIDHFDDPGEPEANDRETIVLKSGPSKGRPWRRKPRLQVRMAPGYEIIQVRKALNLAVCMAEGTASLRVDTLARKQYFEQRRKQAQAEMERRQKEEIEKVKNHQLPETREEMERLQAMVSVLSFEPLRGGVQDRSDALYILGFAPKSFPDNSEVRARFRMLATIHHPDGKYGSHERMSQLNAAMDILRRAS